MRIALKFAYNGKKYNGFARQPNMLTVEGEIIKILLKNNFINDLKTSIFRSASRTDKGVSALSNVIAFNTNHLKTKIIEKLSKEFTNILFYGFAIVDDDFNPRFAKMRQYRYYLSNENLDVENIITTANVFTGEHNFSNFARVEDYKNSIRSIDNIVISETNDFLFIDFFAKNFLWNQIRRIISALIKVGNNKIKNQEITRALNNPKIKLDFGLAPGDPLILKEIFYDFNFEINKKNFKRLELFESQIISNL